MPEIFKHQDISRVPKFFGQNWKTFNLYDFLDRVKFPKLPGIFPELAGTNFSWIFPSIRICWVLKFLSKNEKKKKKKKKTYIICPKSIGQNKNSETGEILSSILENTSQELWSAKNKWVAWKTNPKFPHAAQTSCVVVKTPQCEQFNIGLN